MNSFIKIGNCYYNINNINKIGFKYLENCLNKNFKYSIIINDDEIFINKEEYYKIKNQIKNIIGDENIYE